MNKNPLVSIVLPTYNRAFLIGETIQSVLDQTYPHWELIVVDDGSTDETKRVIQSFGENKIAYIFIDHTGNLSAVRNEGLRHVRGEYTAFLDSDDLWRKDKLQLQMDLLSGYPEASFVFSSGIQFGEGVVDPPVCETLFVGDVFLDQLLHDRFCIYSPTFLFKSNIPDVVGKLDESIPAICDVDFFYRMSFQYEGIFTNEHLVKIRKHKQSTSKALGDAAYQSTFVMLKKFMDMKMISPAQYKSLAAHFYYKLGLTQFRRGDKTSAAMNFRAHRKLDPLNIKGWIRLYQATLGL